MDLCRNVSGSGGFPATFQPEQQLLSPNLDDLFSSHSMAECDINTEWLSIFVEDCLSSSGSCIPINPQSTTSNAQGPDGPKTLCNACGVRYKSGRLLPEYRPAKSPTFVSYKHSNSHKKVLEMRMCSSSSSSSC
nr:GATA transcription factor 2-like [Tanacetum cinerariifolium]